MEVFGSTREALFANAALALFDLLVEARDVQAIETREIRIDGADMTDLFINYLREILYLFNGEGLLLTACRIRRIDDRNLMAEIRCGPYDPQTHRVKMEIKAVTYHQASVRYAEGKWIGRVILDI